MAKPISILIIDDNENFLKTISQYLTENHPGEILVLETALSARRGVSLAQKLLPQVILLDMKMPDLHAFDVIPLLREAHPGIKIITTTLLPVEIYEQSGYIYTEASTSAGADAFIPKHKLTTDLVPAVLRITRAPTNP
jgi:DNA-binding NarL/FixJ family response regulator